MELQNLEQWIKTAPLIAAVANVIALVFILFQVRSAKRMQKQSAARQLYGDFLAFVAANPDSVRIEDITPGSQYDWTMYLWLTALESGWLAFNGSHEWRQRIFSCARQNLKYFESDYWQGTGKYSNKDVSQDFDADFLKVFRTAIAEEKKNEAPNGP